MIANVGDSLHAKRTIGPASTLQKIYGFGFSAFRKTALTKLLRASFSEVLGSGPGFLKVKNIGLLLRKFIDQGIQLVGTSDRVDKSLYDLNLTSPTAVILGSEGWGIRKVTADRCDHLSGRYHNPLEKPMILCRELLLFLDSRDYPDKLHW